MPPRRRVAALCYLSAVAALYRVELHVAGRAPNAKDWEAIAVDERDPARGHRSFCHTRTIHVQSAGGRGVAAGEPRRHRGCPARAVASRRRRSAAAGPRPALDDGTATRRRSSTRPRNIHVAPRALDNGTHVGPSSGRPARSGRPPSPTRRKDGPQVREAPAGQNRPENNVAQVWRRARENHRRHARAAPRPSGSKVLAFDTPSATPPRRDSSRGRRQHANAAKTIESGRGVSDESRRRRGRVADMPRSPRACSAWNIHVAPRGGAAPGPPSTSRGPG